MVYKLLQQRSETSRFARKGLCYSHTRDAGDVTAKVQQDVRASKLPALAKNL